MGWPILLERTLRAVTRVAVLLSGTMQKVQNLLKTSHATTIWAKKEVELVLVFLAPGWDLNVIEGIRSICTDPEPPFFGTTRSTCALPGSLGSVSCLCFLQDKHPDLTSFRILFAPRMWTQLLYFNIVLMRPKCEPDALRLYGKCALTWASLTIEKDSDEKTDKTIGDLEIPFLSRNLIKSLSPA